MCQRVDDDIDAEACIVLDGESLVRPVVVPFAAVILVGVEDSDAPVNLYRLQVIVNDVVAPAVQLVRCRGRTVLELEEGAVERMVVRQFAHRLFGAIEDGLDLALESFGEGSVYVVIAIVNEEKAATPAQ